MHPRRRKQIEGVVVGLSGGIDSSMAAWMLAEQGYRVAGVTLRFYCYARSGSSRRPCCSDAALRRARAICARLGIAHRVIDAEDEFARTVIDPFVREYRRGRTPNPCIVCNAKVKFPALARVADWLGCRFVATGHYARLARDPRGRVFLAAAIDGRKDQSYFLYRVPVKILERAIFPLGEMSKGELSDRAAALGVRAPGVPESQDVCFVADGDLERFLGERIGSRAGEVVDARGRFLGTHSGVHHYTIGQRKGLGIAGGQPLYVREIDAGRRRIVLGPKEDVFHSAALCRGLKLRTFDLGGSLKAKVRYRKPLAEVACAERSGSELTVLFREPQWAITPGQSLVLYRGDLVVGGGIIVEGRKAL
jgi:tRNA-specific 2-thiouridylase